MLADDQGVRVRLSASVADGRIAALRFRAWGCPHLIAAVEWVCSHYEGELLQALEKFPVAGLWRIWLYLSRRPVVYLSSKTRFSRLGAVLDDH